MKLRHPLQRSLLFAAILVTANGCLELYNPPTSRTNYNFLVIDGFLNASDTTFITLSRTQVLSTVDSPVYVTNGIVSIDDDQGATYPLSNLGTGSYYLLPQYWSPTSNYRVHVTVDAKDYTSDFVPLTVSPPIDSVTFSAGTTGVQLYVNTHDPTGQAKYYFWTFTETWEYTPPYRSYVMLQNGQVVQRPDDIYHCWRTLPSAQLYLASTSGLNQDIVSQFPLNLIELNDGRLQHEYSPLVRQQVLTRDAYEYWSTLQKNTENLGTLFGPQPSQLSGNIHNTSNSSETVLGYFSAGSTSEQRIFIHNSEVPFEASYLGYQGCQFDTLSVAVAAAYNGPDLLTSAVFKGIVLIGYQAGPPACVDCRLHGGTNVMPYFWRN